MKPNEDFLIKHNSAEIIIGNSIINITFAKENFKSPQIIDSPRHMHLFSEIHYVRTGEVCVENDFKEKICLGNKNICIIPAGMHHSVKLCKQPLERVCMFFDISKKEGSDFDTYSCLSKVFSGDKIEVKENTLPYFDEIFMLFSKNTNINAVSKEKLKNLASLILIDFYEKNRETMMLREEDGLKYKDEIRLRIEEFLQNSPVNQLKLEKLADNLHLSTRQTDRLIKKYTGNCFRDIVIGIKIDASKTLMQTTKMSFEEIASHLGYNSYAGFCNAFKRVTGVLPRKYKQGLSCETN